MNKPQNSNNWYSPVAQAYNKVRPGYPQSLINHLLELAQLSPQASILEIGCGPATATVSFAQLGYKMLCIEPSQEFCEIAQQNCNGYPLVKFDHTNFEDWQPQPQSFDAVLAATSIHWIPAEIAFPKAAEVLKNPGYLMLLWNASFQIQPEIYPLLNPIYQKYTPSLAWYDQKAKHQEGIKKIAQKAISSGLFKDLLSEELEWEITYTSDEYLLLLSTFSPYINLDATTREGLLTLLKTEIDEHLNGEITLGWLSMFHIVTKI